ncbi:9636_t:CDS:1 [Ambispora leptoticha]|uniref:9636_t:CDS:1 n=1 Tax=Ambispora leptoticha TaxID=144679 RepID=A0A9N8VP31_9GLOM|nr:9636_t:CDS:1 [Ambispora leptoticha]
MDSNKSVVEVSNNGINDNEFIMRKSTTLAASSSDRASSIAEFQTPSKKPRQRTNTLRILIHATMQLLTSPPLSPTLPSSPNESINSTDSEQSSYISFPEYDIYDEINDNIQNGSRGETESMVLQMEEFDEMLVNGVRVLRSSN